MDRRVSEFQGNLCVWPLFLSSLLTVYAYKFVPLSLGPVLEASGYVFVSVMGYFILKEKIGKKKLLGLVIIIAGIVIFNL